MTSYVKQLTQKPLAKPCDETWGNMVGDDKTRMCARCEKRVYNLSAMTPREAEIRLLNAKGHPCIQYRLDGAGQVLMQREPTPSAGPRLNAAVWVAGAISLAAVGGEARAEAPSPPPATSSVGPALPADPEQCQKPAVNPGTAAPAPAPAPAPATQGAPPPPMLAGAPVMIQKPVPHGTLEVKSSRPLRFTVSGVEYQAPSPSVALPPGKHELVAYDGQKVVKKVTLSIKDGQKVSVDLK